jgi:hypothetical protein
MVDAATHQLRAVMTPAQLSQWDATNRMTSSQLREGVEVVDAIRRVEAKGSMPRIPAVVLTGDKPYRSDLLPAGTNPEASLTFTAWQAAQDRIATELDAQHITNTRSGHHIYLYSPKLVVDAIHQIVDDVRRGHV